MTRLRDPQAIIARYTAGESPEAIGASYDVTGEAVRAYLRRRHVQLRPRGGANFTTRRVDWDDVIRRYHARQRIEFIAFALECSAGTVARIARLHKQAGPCPECAAFRRRHNVLTDWG